MFQIQTFQVIELKLCDDKNLSVIPTLIHKSVNVQLMSLSGLDLTIPQDTPGISSKMFLAPKNLTMNFPLARPQAFDNTFVLYSYCKYGMISVPGLWAFAKKICPASGGLCKKVLLTRVGFLEDISMDKIYGWPLSTRR